MWLLFTSQTFPELCSARARGTPERGTRGPCPIHHKLTTQCPAPRVPWPLHPAPASPPRTESPPKAADTRQTCPACSYLWALARAAPSTCDDALSSPYPLQRNLLVTSSGQHPPTPGRTSHPSLCALPSSHPVGLATEICAYDASPSLEGPGGVSCISAPRPPARHRVHSRQRHTAEEQMTVNTWPQPSLIKQARKALECHRLLLSAPLPLRPDAGFTEDRHHLPHSV